jgi:hypothetical protein
MDTSVWDITKSVVLVGVVLLAIFKGPAILNSFEHTTPVLPQEIIVQLAENKVAIENMRADTRQAKELIRKLENENGQQASLLATVKESNRAKDSKIEELGTLVAKVKQEVELQKRDSDHVYKPDSKDPNEQYFKKIYATDTDGKKFPVAWAIFLPNQPQDKKWKTGIYPLEYHALIVESENVNGTFDRHAEIHLENNQMAETTGEEYPISLTDINWEKFEVQDKRFYWWNPRIGLGATFTDESIAPGLDLSISSYGKTKRDMDWRFLTFGAGVATEGDDTLGIFSFEPFSWNVGNTLPIVENLFIGPVGTMDTESNYGFGVKLSIPF